MTDQLALLPVVDLYQCLIYGEARNQPLDGMAAVALVAKNRALAPTWWGRTLKEVVLKPKQFSCFNQNDPNFKKLLLAYEQWNEDLNKRMTLCRWVAGGVLLGIVPDITLGATHYHVVSMKRYPSWARRLVKTVVIADHVFYRRA